MKKLISKLKEVPDLESRHPWSSVSQTSVNNENINTVNLSSPAYHTPNYSHLNNFIGKKFTIGRFLVIVEEIIAEGGFGLVFKVRSQNDHIFALKRLCVNNRSDLKVCKREITIMSSLTHKNILSLIDSQINEQQSGIYEVLMLLTYCPRNVAQLMQSKQRMQQHLSENVIIKILCDIIEAVARLHYCQTPVIHRDLKVENILLDDRNNYVLCDFGSATARQIVPTEYGITKAEEEISKYTTLAYRSPEMVELGSTLINCKSDIWGLGCLAYYLCYFTLPFGDKILAIQSGKFAIPKTDVVYSEKFLKLIQYMLTVDPSDRPSIYQVSVLAFSLANKKSPIQNLDKEKVPHWNDLPLPNNSQSPKKPVLDVKSSLSTNFSKENDEPKNSPIKNFSTKSKQTINQTRTLSTSINPRIRPRANKPPTGRSDPSEQTSENSLDKPVSPCSKSNSFSICLSNSKPNLPKLNIKRNIDSVSVQQEVQAKSNPTSPIVNSQNVIVNELPDSQNVLLSSEKNSSTDRIDNPKLRYGHRRMVSESSLKPVVEESIKSGQSLLELTTKYSSGHLNPYLNDDKTLSLLSSNKNSTVVVAIHIGDDDVDNDALFGEEFDKIRHQSGTSIGTDI